MQWFLFVNICLLLPPEIQEDHVKVCFLIFVSADNLFCQWPCAFPIKVLYFVLQCSVYTTGTSCGSGMPHRCGQVPWFS